MFLYESFLILLEMNKQELEKFFSSTFRLLKDVGSFVAVTFNPDFKMLGVSVYNRIFSEIDGKMKVDFLNEQEKIK